MSFEFGTIDRVMLFAGRGGWTWAVYDDLGHADGRLFGVAPEADVSVALEALTRFIQEHWKQEPPGHWTDLDHGASWVAKRPNATA